MTLDELFQHLRSQTMEDRTRHGRQTRRGPRVDFEILERTSFAKGYPETTREYWGQPPLACGHSLSQEIKFGGECQARSRRGVCGEEFCTLCSARCARCGCAASLHCCARVTAEGVILCRPCRRLLGAANAARRVATFLAEPFRDA